MVDVASLPPIPDPLPDLSERPGWRRVSVLPGVDHEPYYVSGEPTGDRVRIAMFAGPDGAIEAPTWFGVGCTGPPGHAHGGVLAAVLDEVMGACAWNAGHPVLLARLTTHNRRPVPLDTVVRCEAHIVSIDGRKIDVFGRICDDAGSFVDCDGLFIAIGSDRFEGMRRTDDTPGEG